MISCASASHPAHESPTSIAAALRAAPAHMHRHSGPFPNHSGGSHPWLLRRHAPIADLLANRKGDLRPRLVAEGKRGAGRRDWCDGILRGSN